MTEYLKRIAAKIDCTSRSKQVCAELIDSVEATVAYCVVAFEEHMEITNDPICTPIWYVVCGKGSALFNNNAKIP